MTEGYTYNEVLFKMRNDSYVTGGDKPPLPLRKPSQMAMHVLKEGTAGQRRAGAGSGLRAWTPRAGRCPPAQNGKAGAPGSLKAKPGPTGLCPRGPSHLLRLQPPGREEEGVGARCGPSREEITVISHTSPPGRQLLAVGCSSSVTFRESEVQRSRGQASSSPRGPSRPAPPRPARPAPRRELPSRTASGSAPPPGRRGTRSGALLTAGSPVTRLWRRDFRPSSARKMAAAVGICNPVLLKSAAEAFSLYT